MGILDRILPWRRNMAEGYPGRGFRGRPMPLRMAVVDGNLCRGSGECVKVCRFGAVRIGEEGKAEILKRRCRGCGVCAAVCPEGAVKMEYTGSRRETT